MDHNYDYICTLGRSMKLVYYIIINQSRFGNIDEINVEVGKFLNEPKYVLASQRKQDKMALKNNLDKFYETICGLMNINADDLKSELEALDTSPKDNDPHNNLKHEIKSLDEIKKYVS